MKNELITFFVVALFLLAALTFLRYFWWVILIVIGIAVYRYHRMNRTIRQAQERMMNELGENASYRQVFENENHDIIEAEYTEHEEQGTTHDH